MPSRDERKTLLFSRLNSVYDELGSLTKVQENTKWGCKQSGRCCKVGLELHWMECEHIARNLQAEFVREPRARARRIRDLTRALVDPEWIPSLGYGDRWCAFYHGGCTIYPFRPAVCRMYGPLLAVDDECPRERLAGKPQVYYGSDVDDLVKRFYKIVDDYGRMTGRDRAIYMPAGVLTFLLSKGELAKLRRRTASKFWRSSHGYRTQFVPERTLLRERGKAGPAIPLTLRATG